MANGRCFFTPSANEEVQHQASEDALDGEYAFRADPGVLPPLETYNAATRELQGIVGACLQDSTSLHVRGTWQPLTAGEAGSRTIDVSALRLVLEVPKRLTNAGYPGDVTKLRFVECGNTIAGLKDHLSAAGLSLKASGADSGDTLVGALSAGSDGGVYGFGAIAEMVVGLHFIVGPDRHVYLERQSYPVMKPDFAGGLSSEFRQDDALFDAALVSFGSFGILHGIMIETRKRIRRNAVRFKRPYDATLKAAITACDPTLIPLPAMVDAVSQDRPSHFELVLVPNERAAPDSAAVIVTYEQDDDASRGLPSSGAEESAAADHRSGVTLAAGVGIPAGRAVEALEVACKAYRSVGSGLAVRFSCRFVKGTKALLGFTRFGSTAIFEMQAADTPKARAFVERIWSAFDDAGIPFTLHWGRFASFLTAAGLRARYGDSAVDQWIASREALLEDRAIRDLFANDVITRLGLAT